MAWARDRRPHKKNVDRKVSISPPKRGGGNLLICSIESGIVFLFDVVERIVYNFSNNLTSDSDKLVFVTIDFKVV